VRRTGGPHRCVAFRPRRAALCAIAVGAALLASAPARAQQCPGARTDPALAAIPIQDRITFLRLRLEAAREPAERWSHVWVIIDGTLTVLQLAAIPAAKSSATRGLLAVGAGTSSVGMFQALLLPVGPGDQVHDGPCTQLVHLEQTLERGARSQALGTSWLAQIGNLAVNAAFGAGAGLVDGRWQTGLVTFGIGWALGEAQILTQPTGLIDDAQQYREGNLGPNIGAPLRAATSFPPAVGVFRLRGGAGISIAWAL
jgi:hypothetical protein